MPLMVPVTIMPLAGAGAVAPKGDSNSRGRPRPWPVPNTFLLRCAICALNNVAMGLSGKMVAITLAYVPMNAKALAFCPTQNAHSQSIKSNSWHPFPGWSQQNPQSKQTSLAHRDRARSTPADDSLERTNLFYTSGAPAWSGGPPLPLGGCGGMGIEESVVLLAHRERFTQIAGPHQVHHLV